MYSAVISAIRNVLPKRNFSLTQFVTQIQNHATTKINLKFSMDICLGLVLTYIGYKCLILTARSSLLTRFQESEFSSYDALRNKPPLFGTLDCSVLLEVLKNKSPFLTNSGSLDALKNNPLERLDARRNNPPLLKILEKFIINFEYVRLFQNRRILGFS